jgi:hypothetical protein
MWTDGVPGRGWRRVAAGSALMLALGLGDYGSPTATQATSSVVSRHVQAPAPPCDWGVDLKDVPDTRALLPDAHDPGFWTELPGACPSGHKRKAPKPVPTPRPSPVPRQPRQVDPCWPNNTLGTCGLYDARPQR